MSMSDRDGLIWYDGKMVNWRDATTHVLTHTLHYGMGVFEGVRAYKTDKGTAIFRLKEHTDRLFRSAHILGMKMPFDKETIFAGTACRRARQQARIRLSAPDGVLWGGSHGHFRQDTVHACDRRRLAWGAYMGAEALEKASASRPRPSRAITSTSPCARPRPTATT